MSGWHHDGIMWKEKTCAVCVKAFTPRSGAHRFCSDACRGKWKYITGSGSTEAQYLKISGDWDRYFSRLIQLQRRKNDGLSVDVLKQHLGAQGGLCALSGAQLTCALQVGVRTLTNASVDRIEAGGKYSPANTRLVCLAVNRWRGDTPTEDYVAWCRKVAQHQGAFQ